MIKHFFRDGIVYTVPRVFSQGLAVLLLPIYTRALSAAEYGSLDLILVFVGLIQIIITLEIQQALARFYGPDNESSKRRNYAFTSLMFTVAGYSMFALITLLYEDTFSNYVLQEEGNLTAYRLAVGFIWFNGLLHFLLALLRADLRSREYSLILISNSFLSALMGVFLVVVMSMGINGLIASMLASSAVCSCILGYRLKASVRGKFESKKLKEMLAFSAPLVVSSLAYISCLYIDRLMLKHFLGLEFVGAYGVAYRIAAIAGLATVGFQGALMPLVYKHHASLETPGQLAELFKNFIGGALALLLLTQIFAGEALTLLADPKFHFAKGCLVLLLPVVILSRLYMFAPGLSLQKKSILITLINIGGAVSNIVLNTLLIPVFGLSGAALSSLLSFMLLFAVHMYFSQKYYHVPHKWNRILLGCLAIGVINWCSQLADLSASPIQQLVVKFLLLGIGCGALLSLGLIRLPKTSSTR